MFSDLFASSRSVFKERVSSPLYGAIVISWLLWNWQIPYLTLFVSEENLDSDKISWIAENHSNWVLLVLYPALSAFALVLVMPFFTNGAYWVSLRFRKWRIDSQQSIEKKTLLTLEQSIALREEVLAQEERIEKMLEAKNREIKQLSTQIADLEDRLKSEDESEEARQTRTEKHSPHYVDDDENAKELAKKIFNSHKANKTFEKAIEFIQGGYSGLLQENEVDSRSLAFLEANNVIENTGEGQYRFSDFGKKVLRVYTDFEI
ncbi:hypothetical protein [Idiomarina loihiensis]|jgi:uncharacterized coiled-coil protein SlyX|uniref:Predicted membrane protein n=1 Tax=Idiomarina loihiensis (strain ATCC BAA-735 / DSM 15497 / L2-TR) TaxID=283942 RepID=Q5QUI7_IDILO|nr:hypothetical protein [Idiomarina loihiensis]AAV82424.1 Predicted membrane protein [Idiomarina loihiensis L2TR]AGM36461.1 hypothetical protein K734_07990 [Idiomarina loihiensis GSL 199]